jgi:ubiquinone/menaquinone biosynthesis C-methylase UbiE
MGEAVVKNYYEGEARQYNKEFYLEKGGYPTLQYRHRYMLEMALQLDLPTDACILDIGCGPGEMVVDLMRHQWRVWGIDIAANMIAIAEERVQQAAAKNEVHLATGDIEQLTFADQQFDLVICSGVVEYLSGDEKWMREISRVLKPGGVLIINVTNRWALRKWTAPLIEPLKKSRFLHRCMNFVKERILRRGKLHHFPFRPRVHSPKGFDRYLADHGYQKLDFRYFDFSVMVAPFDTLLGFVTVPIRKWMERFSHRNLVLFGTGYIVSARKHADAPNA